MEFLTANQSEIARLTVSTPSQWMLDVLPDGSGRIGVFGQREVKAAVPAGTFDFAALRDRLLAACGEGGDCADPSLVFFFRSGRGYAEGKAVRDVSLVAGTIERALNAATGRGEAFERLLRERPPLA